MQALFVYKSGDPDLVIPDAMGAPSPGQMRGTTAERLVELCGRVCYDSLGRGRDSGPYHEHLFASRHWSVHEHVHFTITCDGIRGHDLIGIPDIVFNAPNRYTFNIRHCLDSCKIFPPHHPLRAILNRAGADLMPTGAEGVWARQREGETPGDTPPWRIVPPQHDNETFITLFLAGSRAFSHEMVRHRNNISQRSGRYCDEVGTPWVVHPLAREIHDQGVHDLGALIRQAREAYANVVDSVQRRLVERGESSLQARKQARAAGRYYLGNGLRTELLYTASVPRWRDIFQQRISEAADAEIREIMTQARDVVASVSP